MTQDEINLLYKQCEDLLQIYNNNNPLQADGTFIIEYIKTTTLAMIDYLFTDENEKNALISWLDKGDYWIAPASSKFHGNFKCGLSLHSLKVTAQCLTFAKPVLENFFTSPQAQKTNYVITAKDIFISALCHDFCKIGFYGVEYRNTKDFSGNWIKQPFYKTKSDNRNLGHGNESVLMLLEVLPEYVHKRYVLEAISRHMGFSDLSESETYNYSNFLQNPLVILLQLADQSSAQWFNC